MPSDHQLMGTTLADTFRALADETRLGLLSTLREDGEQRAGDLAARYPRLSRPAVSRHLAVLREAGLVRTRQQGTERWYRLDPRPLQQLDHDWLATYRTMWTEKVARLKTLLEAGPARPGEH